MTKTTEPDRFILHVTSMFYTLKNTSKCCPYKPKEFCIYISRTLIKCNSNLFCCNNEMNVSINVPQRNSYIKVYQNKSNSTCKKGRLSIDL